MTQGPITGPMSFDDWFNQQQNDPNASNSWAGPNQYAHQAYDQYAQYGYLDGQLPVGDPRALPPGFMQSDYGPAYRGVLNDPSGNYDSNEDPNHVRDWLRNAVPQFNAGRSLQDWNRSMDSGDNSGISGIIGNIGMVGAGVLSGGLTNAGIAAINSQPMSPSSVPYNPPPASGGNNGNGGTVPTQSNGLFDNLLGTAGNLSPALLAGYLGNSQRQDVMGQVGRLNDLAGSLNGPAFMQSITNPYDLQTGQGRTALSQSLQQRGVGGSSFGNQQLGNYDYQRGIGRGDLATRAGTAVAGTQGQLYSNALHGMVGANAAYNNLLGAGLGASGSLFNRPGGSGTGLGGSLGGSIGSWISNRFGSGIPTLPGAPPNFTGTGVDQYGNPTSGNFSGGDTSQYGDLGGNWDPNTGLASSSGMNPIGGGVDLSAGNSGNGLFDWLSQNGGDYGLGF